MDVVCNAVEARRSSDLGLTRRGDIQVLCALQEKPQERWVMIAESVERREEKILTCCVRCRRRRRSGG